MVGFVSSGAFRRRLDKSRRKVRLIVQATARPIDGTFNSTNTEALDQIDERGKRSIKWWPMIRSFLVRRNKLKIGQVQQKRQQKRTKKTVIQVISLLCAFLMVSPNTSGVISQFWNDRIVPVVSNRFYHASRVASESGFTDQYSGSNDPSSAHTTGNVDINSAVKQASDELHQVTKERSMPPIHVEDDQNPTAQSPGSERMSAADKRREALAFVTEAVDQVGPSVLRIDTETQLTPDGRQFSRSDFVQQGQGSGLIFSKEGHVLTNAHVVEGATKVTVTLTDGRMYEARVMGCDEIVDIAVLRIIPPKKGKLDPLPVARLGDSDKLQVGQIVVAVGSPGGLDNTVTMGIVSGLERSSTMVGIPHKKVDYIQTDAAINP